MDQPPTYPIDLGAEDLGALVGALYRCTPEDLGMRTEAYYQLRALMDHAYARARLAEARHLSPTARYTLADGTTITRAEAVRP